MYLQTTRFVNLASAISNSSWITYSPFKLSANFSFSKIKAMLGIWDLSEVLPQGPDTILLFSLVSKQGTNYVAIPHMFKVFIQMLSNDPNDFFPSWDKSQWHISLHEKILQFMPHFIYCACEWILQMHSTAKRCHSRFKLGKPIIRLNTANCFISQSKFQNLTDFWSSFAKFKAELDMHTWFFESDTFWQNSLI